MQHFETFADLKDRQELRKHSSANVIKSQTASNETNDDRLSIASNHQLLLVFLIEIFFKHHKVKLAMNLERTQCKLQLQFFHIGHNNAYPKLQCKIICIYQEIPCKHLYNHKVNVMKRQGMKDLLNLLV